MRAVFAHSAAEMQALQYRWQPLETQRGCTLFQSFAWNQLAARVFARREWPWVVFAETGNGIAIVPAVLGRSGGCIGLLGETLFDYRNVLAAGEDDALTLAWSRIADLKRPLTVLAVRGEHARQWWESFELAPFCTAPMVSLEATSADSFRAAHPRLGRYSRSLAREGVELRRYNGREADLIRHIYRLKANQPTQDPNLFQDPLRVEFIVAAAALDPRGCEVFTFENGSQLVSALVTFRNGHVRHFYTTYFNQAWARYSPGTVLLYEATCLSLADGLDCDYMTGEQPHKQRLATSAVPLFRVEASAEALATLRGSREMRQVAA